LVEVGVCDSGWEVMGKGINSDCFASLPSDEGLRQDAPRSLAMTGASVVLSGPGKSQHEGQDAVDLLEDLKVIQTVHDLKLNAGGCQGGLVFSDAEHGNCILRADEPEDRAEKIGGFDGGPIDHGRAPGEHGWNTGAFPKLPVVRGEGGGIQPACAVSLEDGRPVDLELLQVLTELRRYAPSQRATHQDEPGNAVGVGGDMPTDLASIREPPKGEALHSAGVRNGKDIPHHFIDGVIRGFRGSRAFTVPAQVDGDDGEVSLETCYVTGLVPHLAAAASTVEQDEGGTGANAFIGDS